jgi:hypothetical protein
MNKKTLPNFVFSRSPTPTLAGKWAVNFGGNNGLVVKIRLGFDLGF